VLRSRRRATEFFFPFLLLRIGPKHNGGSVRIGKQILLYQPFEISAFSDLRFQYIHPALKLEGGLRITAVQPTAQCPPHKCQGVGPPSPFDLTITELDLVQRGL